MRRVVASGNGAAYYVAHALWLAAVMGPGGGPDIKFLNGADGAVIREFNGFDAGFTGGVFVGGA